MLLDSSTIDAMTSQRVVQQIRNRFPSILAVDAPVSGGKSNHIPQYPIDGHGLIVKFMRDLIRRIGR
jgi:hypothetical protein